MKFFEVEGGAKLKGTVHIPGAKNAALPMLCASLLTSEKCVFRNVPQISDVEVLLDIFEEIGVEVVRKWKSKTIEVQAKKISPSKLSKCEKVKKLRASLLVLGPILSRLGEVEIFQPGGCILGARPNFIHMDGLKTLGAKITREDEKIGLTFNRKSLKSNRILLSEASVTGTENLAIFLAGQDDASEIYFSAAEPHVQGTLRMLCAMGADIDGIGTHYLRIRGRKDLHGGEFTIPPDGLLVGTYAIAGILTQGDLLIENVDHRELFSFYGMLKRVGANFEMKENALHIFGEQKMCSIPKIQTAIYPGFSTDLQSPFGVLLTQCKGESLVFETLFENRLTYLSELEKMGAKIQILNPHQAKITGPVQLQGAEVQSWDLRAGAAMVLAGLIAKGKTRISNVNYIDRGYENFPENLAKLGAKIKRIEE
jgi:UDP-N-acetylglucosamine 1-carboxyvinyltransferase